MTTQEKANRRRFAWQEPEPEVAVAVNVATAAAVGHMAVPDDEPAHLALLGA